MSVKCIQEIYLTIRLSIFTCYLCKFLELIAKFQMQNIDFFIISGIIKIELR